MAVLLMISIVGAPLGFGLLFAVWPAVAFIGYLVAGIWIGEWILARTSPGVVRERPYLAAAIGVFILQVLAIVPPITFVASLFGLGAVVLLGWRTLRGPQTGHVAAPGSLPAPVGV